MIKPAAKAILTFSLQPLYEHLTQRFNAVAEYPQTMSEPETVRSKLSKRCSFWLLVTFENATGRIG